jgi:serine/threonine-protein kinase RsbW
VAHGTDGDDCLDEIQADRHSAQYSMNSPSPPQTINRVLPSNLTAYPALIEEILSSLKTLGWTREQWFGVWMALEESISNAVRHGNKHDPNKQVYVDCELSPERFFVKIRDEGAGYDPCTVPDCCANENLEVPGGRGLALMRAYMNRVELTDQGRCVVMEKVLE